MTTRKILLGVGLLAALSIAYLSFRDGGGDRAATSGAIGVSDRYRGYFHKLVTDQDFQTIASDGTLGKFLATVFPLVAATDPQLVGAGAIQWNRLGQVVGDLTFRSQIASRDFEAAGHTARSKGWNATPSDLQTLSDIAALGTLTPRQWDSLGQVLRDEAFQNVAGEQGFALLLTESEFQEALAGGRPEQYLATHRPDFLK